MVDNKSERTVARYFGIHRNAVRKMCQFAAPPCYRRTPAPVSPTLDKFVAIIDAILEADKQVHVKQRHTAVRSRERLRGERYWAMASADGTRPLLSCRAITCVTKNSGLPPKVTTRAKWKDWWARASGTSWCHCRWQGCANWNISTVNAAGWSDASDLPGFR